MDFKKYIRPGRTASDITPLLANEGAFRSLIDELSGKFKSVKIDKVVCIEARGFLLGGAVAYKLGVGVIPVRKSGLQNEVHEEGFVDYSGKAKILSIHKDAIKENEKVIIVDDWVETGAGVKAAINLVEKCGGRVVGIGVLMDDSSDETKHFLNKYNYHFLEQSLPGDNI